MQDGRPVVETFGANAYGNRAGRSWRPAQRLADGPGQASVGLRPDQGQPVTLQWGLQQPGLGFGPKQNATIQPARTQLFAQIATVPMRKASHDPGGTRAQPTGTSDLAASIQRHALLDVCVRRPVGAALTAKPLSSSPRLGGSTLAESATRSGDTWVSRLPETSRWRLSTARPAALPRRLQWWPCGLRPVVCSCRPLKPADGTYPRAAGMIVPMDSTVTRQNFSVHLVSCLLAVSSAQVFERAHRTG